LVPQESDFDFGSIISGKNSSDSMEFFSLGCIDMNDSGMRPGAVKNLAIKHARQCDIVYIGRPSCHLVSVNPGIGFPNEKFSHIDLL
jgi:hypothetical protein